MTDVFSLLWMADVACVVHMVAFGLFVTTVAWCPLIPLIVMKELATWRQCFRGVMIAWAVVGASMSLIPSPKTLHIAAAAVAAERSMHAEIDQEIKQAVLDALRGTAKEGGK